MDALFYLLKSAVLLSIFYVVYIVLLRKETHFVAHRIYLLAGVIGSFLFPLLYFTRTIYMEAPTVSPGISTSEMIPLIAKTSVETAIAVNWWMIAATVYFIGIAVVLLRFIKQLISLLVILNSNQAKRINGFRYIQVSENIAPFSFFSHIVYNPQLHTEQELKMILKHEQAHSFQWHSLDILLANVLVMLQWANPLAWLYKKSVEENLEFLADNATASRVLSKKDYQLALVKASSAYYTPALTTNFYKSFIKKRIIMLNKSTSKRRNLFKLAVVLPFVAIFLYGFNMKETVIYKEVPSEKITEPVETFVAVAENSSGQIQKTEEKTATQPVSEITPEIETVTAESLQKDTVRNEYIPKTEHISTIYSSSKDVNFKITKNTTDAELLKLKEELKRDHNIDFSYEIVRNSKNEITSISIQYKEQGKNGSFNITSDDAINDFYFFINDEGESGFWSERAEARNAARAIKLVERINDRNELREVLIVERKAMRDGMTQKRMVMRDKMDEERDKMRVMREVIYVKRDEQKVLMEVEKRQLKEYIILRNGQDDINENRIYVARGLNSLYGNTKIINKNTTDATLAKMKSDLSAEGIDFNYSKVKRNSSGEITRIKIVVNNHKGSKQTIVTTGDDGKPIDKLIVRID